MIISILNEIEKIVQNKKYISQRKKILYEYIERTKLLNKKVEVKVIDKKIIGTVRGINDRGGLIIIKENGRKEIIYNGELKGAEN